jgi:hypothetical protein
MALDLANRHFLSDSGKRQAAQLLEYDGYTGPAPVVLKDYWRQVTDQSISLAGVTPPTSNGPCRDWCCPRKL